MRLDRYDWALLAVATVSALASVWLILQPSRALASLGAGIDPGSRLLVALAGALLLPSALTLAHTLFNRSAHAFVLLWFGLQQFGISATLGIGVVHEAFAPNALRAAACALLFGGLTLWIWSRRTAVLPSS